MIDKKTDHLALPLPDEKNMLEDDCPRIREAFRKVDEHAATTDAALAARLAQANSADDSIAALQTRATATEQAQGVTDGILAEHGQTLLAHGTALAAKLEDSPPTPEKRGAVRVGAGLHLATGDNGETDVLTVSPDGVTTQTDESGLLSAIGGNLQFNDELWLTESGEWTALADGLHEITCFDGGGGGAARDMGVIGGGTGAIKIGYAFLKKGVVYNAIIGAPGQGAIGSYARENKGGQTNFSGLVNYQTIPGESVVFVDARGNGIYRVRGLGPGGGHPPNFSSDGTVDDVINASWYGSGGAASVEVISGSYRYMAGKGGPGAIRFRFWNPAKAAGPEATPALLSARRMAAPRAAAAPATVNIYDQETGQGSVWREEDVEAKLAEGLITQEAWLEICAARAAEHYAEWLASPETEAERFTMLRAARDAKLAATDYLVAPDYPLSEEQKALVTAYRQALRDLPAEAGAPWDGGGELTPWPELPAIAKVTA